MLHPSKLNKGITNTQHHRHADGMAEQGRLRRQMAADAQANIAPAGEPVIRQAVLFHLAVGQCLFGFNICQLCVNRAQIFQQVRQRLGQLAIFRGKGNAR
ncbi:hypothetical protein D3C71_1473120 [compost metagenome]